MPSWKQYVQGRALVLLKSFHDLGYFECDIGGYWTHHPRDWNAALLSLAYQHKPQELGRMAQYIEILDRLDATMFEMVYTAKDFVYEKHIPILKDLDEWLSTRTDGII